MMCPLCPRPDSELEPDAWHRAQLASGRNYCATHTPVRSTADGRDYDRRGRLVYAPRSNAALAVESPGPRKAMPHKQGQIGLMSELLSDSPNIAPFGRIEMGRKAKT